MDTSVPARDILGPPTLSNLVECVLPYWVEEPQSGPDMFATATRLCWAYLQERRKKPTGQTIPAVLNILSSFISIRDPRELIFVLARNGIPGFEHAFQCPKCGGDLEIHQKIECAVIQDIGQNGSIPMPHTIDSDCYRVLAEAVYCGPCDTFYEPIIDVGQLTPLWLSDERSQGVI